MGVRTPQLGQLGSSYRVLELNVVIVWDSMMMLTKFLRCCIRICFSRRWSLGDFNAGIFQSLFEREGVFHNFFPGMGVGYVINGG